MDKSRIIIILRRLLLATIVAVAILSIGWFIYSRFFKAPGFTGSPASREGIANTIREHMVETPDIVRMQMADRIRQNMHIATTPQTKDGVVTNTTPVSQRELIFKSISHQQ